MSWSSFDRFRCNVAEWNPVSSAAIDLDWTSSLGRNDQFRNLNLNLPDLFAFPRQEVFADFYHERIKTGPYKGRFPVQPCIHTVVDLNIPLIGDFDWYYGSELIHSHWPTSNRPRIPFDYSWLGKVGFQNSPTNQDVTPLCPQTIVDTCSEEAFNYFSDVFPEQLSFAEFLQGLTQLTALLPKIEASITKTISGGYLNKKFGWDNLISDLGTLGSIIQEVVNRMEYLRRTYGIPTRLGFHRQNIYTPSNLSAYTSASPGWYGLGGKISLISANYDYRATGWVTQTLDHVTDTWGFLRGLFGALGLNNPVKAFWNTVPLSFVVDWFFRISTHLDNLTRLSPGPGWDVNFVTHSVTSTWTYKVEHYTAPYVSPSSLAQGTIVAKRYERNVGLSFDLGLLDPSELSPSQLTLLAAMLHQLS